MTDDGTLRQLVREVEAAAKAHPGRRVRRLRLWVGAFCPLSEAELRSCWPSAAEGVAGSAHLDVVPSADIVDPHARSVRLLEIEFDET